MKAFEFFYFCCKFIYMKKTLILVLLLLFGQNLLAQNEIGPEGHKLLWVFLALLLIGLVLVFGTKSLFQKVKLSDSLLFRSKKVRIELNKDTLYYPDTITLLIENTGNADIDLDRPLLIFDNFWLKRKFKLKGMDNHSFYPLYLEKGKSHSLQIDLNRFYQHDKSLKKYPKVKLLISEVNGKKLGARSVFLRKTLFKF